MSSSLVISVITETGVINSVTIANPKENVTSDEVKEFAAVMEREKLHTFKGGDIAKVKGAKIVTKNKKKFSIY